MLAWFDPVRYNKMSNVNTPSIEPNQPTCFNQAGTWNSASKIIFSGLTTKRKEILQRGYNGNVG